MRRRVQAVLISVEVIVVVLLVVFNVFSGGDLGPSEGREELMLADPEVLVTQV